MLGQRTAELQPAPARWIRRLWGCGDIHARQKWSAAWTLLAEHPREGVRLLDAGCGAGGWALEIARLRPDWAITGIDRDAGAIAEAERARHALGIGTAAFAVADFLDYAPPQPFDIVLSIASAHYLAGAGRGAELFEAFRAWLAPGGTLVLLAPRARAEAGFRRSLRRPAWHDVFTRRQLEELCNQAGLQVRQLAECVGPWGTLAKQLAWTTGEALGKAAVAGYPLQVLLTAMDERLPPRPGSASAMWLLEATPRG